MSVPQIVPGGRGNGLTQSPSGAPQQVTKIFPLQSYFDSQYEALTPNPAAALLEQPTNKGIIQSTLQAKNQVEAYAIGLAPWSESPIAASMQTQSAGGLSSPLILRPGEVFAPSGIAQGSAFSTFKGVQWGLPFGWLGGGLVSVFFFKSPDTLPKWGFGAREVQFHNFQTAIRLSANLPPTPQRTNWPTRFPWKKAYRGSGANGIDQTNDANVAVVPTKTIIRLNNVALVAPEPCRAVFWGTDTLDIGTDGITPTATQNSYWEFAWPDNTTGGWAANQQMLTLPDEFSKLASNAWGVTFECLPGSPLLGATINVARFGLI